MPIFRMQISSVARGVGRRATAAAAYRAGERLRDERTGQLSNFSRRRDVLHAEIFLPSQFDGVAVAWARNRERLWNTAEHAEKRHNSRVAREYQVILPFELSPVQRVALARAFSREIADRYKVAVDLAVHEPRPDGDPRNYHAHLLTTTREITPAGLGAKTGLDMPAIERRRRALADHRQEYVNVRERWAALTNAALREAHIEGRVDHRSLAAQGIDREPQPAIPLMHLKMEQRGLPSPLAERLRAEYRERVLRRLERTNERTAGASAPPQPLAAARSTGSSPAPQDVEDVRRQAREAWLQLRSREAGKADASFREQPQTSERQTRSREVLQPEVGPQDDLAL
jgi:ATP-dependent exoDNAse (exonuclease V) alpha subunit